MTNDENGWDDDDLNLDDGDDDPEPDDGPLGWGGDETNEDIVQNDSNKEESQTISLLGWDDDFDISDHKKQEHLDREIISKVDPSVREESSRPNMEDFPSAFIPSRAVIAPTMVQLQQNEPPIYNSNTADDGWDDDNLDFLDENESGRADGTLAPAELTTMMTSSRNDIPASPEKTPSRLINELLDYVQSLPHHVQSIQRVLAAEYNTYEKAMELRTYYADRPALLEYTLEKEIPRMDYTVVYAGDVASPNSSIDPKSTVRQMLRHAVKDESSTMDRMICSRCANQSLLADVLQVLTGNDRVVRPQYMAVAVATACQFHVDLDASIVQAIATLDLSLPTMSNNQNNQNTTTRWKVAEIPVIVVFEPEQFLVDFRVTDIRLTPQDKTWHDSLRDCAALLEMMLVSDNEHGLVPPTGTQSVVNDLHNNNFRDRFLQSQNMLQASAAGAVQGIKSAWHDIDAATGFGKKLKHILPDTADVLVKQAEEAATFAATVAPKQHRPTSILGGLVRSLAKSVALPDEEEEEEFNFDEPVASLPPKLYNNTTAPHRPASAAVVAVSRRQNTPTIIPRLYNRDDSDKMADTTLGSPFASTASTNTPIPRLYNRDDTKQLQEAADAIPFRSAGSALPLDGPDVQRIVNEPVKSPVLEVSDKNGSNVNDGWDDLSLDGDEIEPKEEDAASPVHTRRTFMNRKRWVNPRLYACRSLALESK